MRKKAKRKRNSFPKSYLRREIILEYFESLEDRVSNFGKEMLEDELKLHDFMGVVDSIFFEEDYQLSYLDCVKILDIILIQNKNDKISVNEILEELSLEEAV